MNGYELSRIWFNWCFENPEMINTNHTALYFFCIEHCNRLGWKQKFGLPTTMAKEALGIKSYNTYKKTLDDLVNFGFIELIEISKNQYSANIIALSNFDKALDNALDKATAKHTSKQSESTGESNCSINKQITKNKELKNEKQIELLKLFDFSETPKHISKQRLISDFFYAKNESNELEYFIEQMDAYGKFLKIGNNIRFRFSLDTFLGDQKESFNGGKWNAENWQEKLKQTNQVKKSKMQY